MQKPVNDPQKTLRQLRLIGWLEGISYLVLLFFAMPMKYMYGDPEWVRKFGMLHGILFIFYMVLLLLGHYQWKWGWSRTIWLFALSLVPFGTFYSDFKFLKGFSTQ